jgi:hypothetical protein
VETVRCPGCGAAVRPQAEWCSLCYLDLGPASQLVTVPEATGKLARDAGAVAAPLVDAALEPTAAGWSDIDGSREEIVDAVLVDSSPPAPGVTGERKTPGLTSDVSWPCTCGASVAVSEDTCADCGGKFLGELRDDATGKHRPGPPSRLQSARLSSRGMRLALAVLAALIVAIGIPLLLALLG